MTSNETTEERLAEIRERFAADNRHFCLRLEDNGLYTASYWPTELRGSIATPRVTRSDPLAAAEAAWQRYLSESR